MASHNLSPQQQQCYLRHYYQLISSQGRHGIFCPRRDLIPAICYPSRHTDRPRPGSQRYQSPFPRSAGHQRHLTPPGTGGAQGGTRGEPGGVGQAPPDWQGVPRPKLDRAGQPMSAGGDQWPAEARAAPLFGSVVRPTVRRQQPPDCPESERAN